VLFQTGCDLQPALRGDLISPDVSDGSESGPGRLKRNNRDLRLFTPIWLILLEPSVVDPRGSHRLPDEQAPSSSGGGETVPPTHEEALIREAAKKFRMEVYWR